MGRAALFVALLALLAGCGGAVSSNEPETVTPAPVPTDLFQYPPGVTSERVVPSQLVSAHARSLATTNYTLTTRQAVRTRDGSVFLQTDQQRMVARNGRTYAGRFYLETTLFTGQRTSEIEFWSNRSITVTRYTTDNPYHEPEIREWPAESERSITDLTDRQHLEGYLAGSEVTSVRRTPDGGVVLVGSGIRDRERLIVPIIITDPQNLSFQMRIRADGVVLAARVTYDATHNSGPVQVEREMRVTDIGTTSVERPPWTRNGTSGGRYTTYG